MCFAVFLSVPASCVPFALAANPLHMNFLHARAAMWNDLYPLQPTNSTVYRVSFLLAVRSARHIPYTCSLNVCVCVCVRMIVDLVVLKIAE